MISFLQKHVLGGVGENANAPHILIVFFIYTAFSISYYILSGPQYMLAWLITCVLFNSSFILLHRSRLSADILSFLAPATALGILSTHAAFFGNNYQIFLLTIGGAMISLTYMKPKGMALYISITTALQLFFLLGLNRNLMGESFAMSNNYANLIFAVCLNSIVYFFCVIYSKLFKAKGVFLSNTSHEIRTPVSAVLGISEIMLQKKDMSPETEEAFARIHNSSKLLLGIINDVLDFSRLEEGKLSILKKRYDLAGVISSVAHPHYAYMGNKDIKFNVDIDKNLPMFLIGDALRIEQIVMNLLSNAFKYTEQGTVDFELKFVAHKEDGIALLFTIRDTGIGMTQKQLETVFNDYTRFHEQEKSNIGGTGIGMSIVNKLIKLMNGQIRMQSAVGKGTTVVVSIPQKIASKEVLGADNVARLKNFEYANSEDNKFSFTPEPMPYGKVLLVDDIETNLYVAKGLLAFYDLNVETCNDGYETLEKIKQGATYDLVLMDYMMPVMNGTQTMEEMRKLGYKGAIVVLTANAIAGSKEKYIDSGFDGYLSKPIITEELNGILVEFIKSKQPQEVIEAAKKSGASKQESIKDFQDSDEFMAKIRTDFAKSQKNISFCISEAAKDGDIEEAQRLAHSFKGLAKLMKETNLAKFAEHMESLLIDGKIPTDEELENLEKEIKHVIDEAIPPTSLTDEESKTLELLYKIKPLLEQRNAKSLDFLEELRLIPETAIIVRQMEKMDFGVALKGLNVLIEIIEK